MAQSPNAVREPSMDELLASIREIIEENAGASTGMNSSGRAPNGVDQIINGSNQSDKSLEIPIDAIVKSQISKQTPALRNGMTMLNDEENISPAQENVPVQAAMNALAERIGLRRQATESINVDPSDENGAPALNSSFSYSPDMKANVSPFPVEKVAPPTLVSTQMPTSPVFKQADLSPTHGQSGRDERVAISDAQSLSSPQPQAATQPHPLQQPLLRSAVDVSTQPPPLQNKQNPSYLANPPAPPQPKIKVSRQSIKQGDPAFASQSQPTPIQVRRAPPATVPMQPPSAQPPLAQAAQQLNVSATPVQPAQLATQKPPSQPFSFQSSHQRPQTKTTQAVPQRHAMDVKQKWDELEQDFRAEFEKSAELLLRPYIAQWLDEHFHHLFEKILREEIQRLVQNLHR